MGVAAKPFDQKHHAHLPEKRKTALCIRRWVAGIFRFHAHRPEPCHRGPAVSVGDPRRGLL